MSSEYQFYEMMGFPAPFQREFFGYFAEEKEFLGGEPMQLSRALPSDSLIKAQEVLKTRNVLWRYLPYIEMVYLTGNTSFNAEDDAVGFWVIASKKRMRSVYIMIKITFFFLNLWLVKKEQMPLRLDVLQDEDSLSIQSLKSEEYDVIPVYQLAHVSVCYQKFDSNVRSLLKENTRIKEFLPNFPLQHVIGCNVDMQKGKTKGTQILESLFGHAGGDFLNIVAKQCVLFCFVCRRTVKGTSVRIMEHIVRRDTWKKDQVMLTRKVLRKE